LHRKEFVEKKQGYTGRNSIILLPWNLVMADHWNIWNLSG